ncbi:MAG: DUF2802 domain-containing protein [Burkholderiales bacterium]|nr:DUF2802 domain-containing protein [Burkholderiales bacterium]
MEAVVVTWRELLIVVVVVLGVYAAELMLLLRWSGFSGYRSWLRLPQRSTDAQRLSGMSLELVELRKQVSELAAEVERLRSSSPAISPYNHAIQMARQGNSAAEVCAACRISRGEAELIVALYRKLRI